MGFDDCVVVDVGNQPDFVRPRLDLCAGIVCDADLQSIFGYQAPQIHDGQVIDRLFRNPKTTIIGLLVMVVSFVFVWFGKATLSDVSILLAGGFTALFLKDPKDDGGKN